MLDETFTNNYKSLCDELNDFVKNANNNLNEIQKVVQDVRKVRAQTTHYLPNYEEDFTSQNNGDVEIREKPQPPADLPYFGSPEHGNVILNTTPESIPRETDVKSIDIQSPDKSESPQNGRNSAVFIEYQQDIASIKNALRYIAMGPHPLQQIGNIHKPKTQPPAIKGHHDDREAVHGNEKLTRSPEYMSQRQTNWHGEKLHVPYLNSEENGGLRASSETLQTMLNHWVDPAPQQTEEEHVTTHIVNNGRSQDPQKSSVIEGAANEDLSSVSPPHPKEEVGKKGTETKAKLAVLEPPKATLDDLLLYGKMFRENYRKTKGHVPCILPNLLQNETENITETSNVNKLYTEGANHTVKEKPEHSAVSINQLKTTCVPDMDKCNVAYIKTRTHNKVTQFSAKEENKHIINKKISQIKNSPKTTVESKTNIQKAPCRLSAGYKSAPKRTTTAGGMTTSRYNDTSKNSARIKISADAPHTKTQEVSQEPLDPLHAHNKSKAQNQLQVASTIEEDENNIHKGPEVINYEEKPVLIKTQVRDQEVVVDDVKETDDKLLCELTQSEKCGICYENQESKTLQSEEKDICIKNVTYLENQPLRVRILLWLIETSKTVNTDERDEIKHCAQTMIEHVVREILNESTKKEGDIELYRAEIKREMKNMRETCNKVLHEKIKREKGFGEEVEGEIRQRLREETNDFREEIGREIQGILEERTREFNKHTTEYLISKHTRDEVKYTDSEDTDTAIHSNSKQIREKMNPPELHTAMKSVPGHMEKRSHHADNTKEDYALIRGLNMDSCPSNNELETGKLKPVKNDSKKSSNYTHSDDGMLENGYHDMKNAMDYKVHEPMLKALMPDEVADGANTITVTGDFSADKTRDKSITEDDPRITLDTNISDRSVYLRHNEELTDFILNTYSHGRSGDIASNSRKNQRTLNMRPPFQLSTDISEVGEPLGNTSVGLKVVNTETEKKGKPTKQKLDRSQYKPSSGEHKKNSWFRNLPPDLAALLTEDNADTRRFVKRVPGSFRNWKPV